MLKRLPINSNTHLYAIQRNHIMKCICSFLRVIHIYLPLCYKSNAPNDPYRDLVVSMEERWMRDDLNLINSQNIYMLNLNA